MPGKKGAGKKGKKGKKGKAGKKGAKKEAVKSSGDGQIPDSLPKPHYLPPIRAPGESLVELLTTHKVEEKELHNFKVNVKPLEELTPQEIRDLRFTFQLFDRNEDGFLTPLELRQALTVLGFKIESNEAMTMCTEAGMIRRGPPSADLNDFLGYVIERQGDTQDYQEEIIRGFKTFDIDSTGTLTLDNLRQVAEYAGAKLSEEELRDMLEEADVNGDGVIDRDEFVNMMLQTNLFN